MGWPVVITLVACGAAFLTILVIITWDASNKTEDTRLSSRALLSLGVLLVLLGFTAIYFLAEHALQGLPSYAG